MTGRRKGLLRRVAILSMLMSVTLSGCVTGFVGESGPGPLTAVPAGTAPNDVVVGRREHPKIVASFGGIYRHRPTELMLATIVGKLMAASDQPTQSYSVTILDSPEVNAFALPGGFIFVTRGILALAMDKSEIAAIISHEMSHVLLRHARARSNRVRTSQVVDRVVTSIFGADATVDQSLARSKASLATFSQRQELDADKEGVKIAGRAGYDPHAAARFLSAMGRFSDFRSKGSSGKDGGFLSSHPSTPDRIQSAVFAARGFGAPGIGEREREPYLTAINGISFGDNPDDGAIRGRRFIHPRFGFVFTAPKGYTLQNSSDAVVGITKGGAALRFDGADVPEKQSLEAYLKSGWIAGLDKATVTTSTSNGNEFATGFAKTEEWVFRISVTRFNGKVYRFILANASDSKAFKNEAKALIKSFRKVSKSDLKDLRPMVLKTVVAAPGATVNSLAAQMRVPSNGRTLFLVLNNLFPGDRIVAGQRYKIIVP